MIADNIMATTSNAMPVLNSVEVPVLFYLIKLIPFFWFVYVNVCMYVLIFTFPACTGAYVFITSI
jgi:hypothetical protein